MSDVWLARSRRRVAARPQRALDAELYSTGAFGASDNRTAAWFAGAFALGVYVEGTVRTLPQELGPVGVGAGVSVRVPFIAAIGT
jgi:hypothetical protein